MLDMGPVLWLIGGFVFVVGTVVGSFLNVCIYRIPWEKSVIWPASRCPQCFTAISARDNIPILSWLALRGKCRECGLPISPRYPFVELLVGILFVGVYVVDVVYGPRGRYGYDIGLPVCTLAYHALLVALLVAATFIDYDLFIIPDQVTVTGMALGIGLGTLVPRIRPEPGQAATHLAGLWVGVLGLLVGAGLTHAIRLAGTAAFRREAMGLGDVTLMGMIGAFLGWQAAVLSVFAGAFFGLAHAFWKLWILLRKKIFRQKLVSSDRELPFGPYLSMGAFALLLAWPWYWHGWGRIQFGTIGWLFWRTLGVDLPVPD